jgi:hypothetical protein
VEGFAGGKGKIRTRRSGGSEREGFCFVRDEWGGKKSRKSCPNPDFLVARQHPRDQTSVLQKAAGIGRDQIVEG